MMLGGIAVIAALTVLLVGPPVSSGSECRVIRIYSHDAQGGEGAVRIEPKATAIYPGTCVIWVNLGKGEMKVTFQDGKSCSDASEAAHGFSMAETCYVTTWLPVGATSSLTFNGKGIYRYEVEWKGAVTRDSGTIVVQ